MRSLLTYWHLDIVMLIFLIAICMGYLFLTHFRLEKRSVYFLSGFGLIIISVASPLHFLGENYLMSAHMASHVILLLVSAPLLVIGIPENRQNRFIEWMSERFSKTPWLSWMTGVCIMWFWHIPVIFNHVFQTQQGTGTGLFSINILQDIQLMSLVLAGILFSWPVMGPNHDWRIAPLHAVLYLSAACIFCSILGLLVTFAPAGVYARYIHIQDHFGYLKIIRNENGISAMVDQQIAGLIMWVPGCLIYLTASMYLLMKWFKEKNEKHVLVNNKMIP
jgi:putative membrane protein